MKRKKKRIRFRLEPPSVIQAASDAASKAPLRMHNQTIHCGRHAHQAMSFAYLQVPEVVRKVVKPPHHLAPTDPSLRRLARTDDHPARAEQDELLTDVKGKKPATKKGKGKALEAVASEGQVEELEELAAEQEEEQDDGQEEEQDDVQDDEQGNGKGDEQTSVASAAVRKKGKGAKEEDEDEDGEDSGKGGPGGGYSIHTTKVTLSGATRAFKPGHVGGKNPLLPLFQLVTLVARCETAIVDRFANLWLHTLATEELLSDAGSYVFSMSKQELKAPLRLAMDMLSKPAPEAATPIAAEEREELVSQWTAVYSRKSSDGAYLQQVRYRLNAWLARNGLPFSIVQRFLERGGIGQQKNAINYETADPAFIHTLLIMSRGQTNPLLPSLPSSKEEWLSDFLKIRIHLAQMHSKKAQGEWLRGHLKQLCGGQAGAAFDFLLAAEAPDVITDGWVGSAHKACGVSAADSEDFHNFLLRFRACFNRLPFNERASSISAIWETEGQKPGELVPFFGALGRKSTVVSLTVSGQTRYRTDAEALFRPCALPTSPLDTCSYTPFSGMLRRSYGGLSSGFLSYHREYSAPRPRRHLHTARRTAFSRSLLARSSATPIQLRADRRGVPSTNGSTTLQLLPPRLSSAVAAGAALIHRYGTACAS